MEQAWEESQRLRLKPGALSSSSSNSPTSIIGKWKPPDKDKVKMNCDASWKKDSEEGYGAVIIRNHKGELIDGKKFKVAGSSALVCEAMALREACLMAKAMKLQSVTIESDGKELISLSVSELDPPWNCACIIQDIRVLVRELNLIVSWIPRLVNRAIGWHLLFLVRFLRTAYL